VILDRQLKRLGFQQKRLVMTQRKADTRHKIQLGGIVVKAGLSAIDPYVLLGHLVEHAVQLNDPIEQKRLRDVARLFASEALATPTPATTEPA
jgi:hypothetical protein